MIPETWPAISESQSSEVISRMLAHLPRGGTLVDVGANVGVVTHAAIASRAATVYAFEPVEEFAQFCSAANPTAQVFTLALGAERTTAPMWCDTWGNPGWNTMVAEKAEPTMRRIEVPVVPLDDFALESLDVLKIDVEGYEHAVLRGGRQTIAEHRPVILVEVGWGTDHPQREAEMAEFEHLFTLGYARVHLDVGQTADFVLVPA